MTDPSKRARIVTVQIKRTNAGLLRATSSSVRGLHVAAPDKATLRRLVCEMLTDLFAVCGEQVDVYEVEPPRRLDGVDFSKLQPGDALVTAREVSGATFRDALHAVFVDADEEGRHPQG